MQPRRPKIAEETEKKPRIKRNLSRNKHNWSYKSSKNTIDGAYNKDGK